MTYPVFSGSIVAIITPLDAQGAVDFASLEKLVEYHINSGTDAIVACGTTGEAATLTEEESLQVIAKCVEFAKDRIPVIAGTGSNCTAKAISYTKKVESLGVAACLTVAPYYNKPNQEGIYQHFKAIAESTALPQILYNVPGRTVVSMDIDTIVRLAALPNVIAIKDAHPDLSRVQQIVYRTKDLNFIHLSGDDPQALEAIRLGSNGVISVTANVLAKEWANIIHLALEGKYEKAFTANEKYTNLHTILFTEPNPAPAKWVAKELGLIATNNHRLPLLPLSPTGEEKVAKVFKAAGVLK